MESSVETRARDAWRVTNDKTLKKKNKDLPPNIFPFPSAGEHIPLSDTAVGLIGTSTDKSLQTKWNVIGLVFKKKVCIRHAPDITDHGMLHEQENHKRQTTSPVCIRQCSRKKFVADMYQTSHVL